MFSSGSGQQSQDNVQRKSLPTDLADPSGQQHDTVRTYGGNQIPLSQEAQLLGIVDVLRSQISSVDEIHLGGDGDDAALVAQIEQLADCPTQQQHVGSVISGEFSAAGLSRSARRGRQF